MSLWFNILIASLYLVPTIFLYTPPKARAISMEQPIALIMRYLVVILSYVLVPVSFRMLVVFFTFIPLFSWRLKLNVLQATWLFFFVLINGIVTEAIVVSLSQEIFLGQFINISENTYVQIGLVILLNLGLALMLSKKIQKFIEKVAHSLKKIQITFPILLFAGATVLTLYNILLIGDGITYAIDSWIFWSFFIGFTMFILVVAFYADRYYKRQAEVNLLREQVSQNFKAQNAFSKFETSVEFDLMVTDFGNTLIESYDIKQMIYDGQNSQIYLLEEKHTGALMTLKAMPFSEGVFSDLNSLHALAINGVAKLLCWGKGERYTYSIKPYYQGISLSQWIAEQGPLSESEIMSVVNRIKAILIELHSQNPPVVFRDVKPSNILIQPSGDVLLVDIETARKISVKGKSDTIIIGSRGYAPPEQYGFSQTGTHSDIYALGATTYFLATGEESAYETIFSSDVAISGLSQTLTDFIRGCMQFDPKLRRW